MYRKNNGQSLLVESFFDSSPDLLAVFDLEGRFIQVNAAYEQVLGFQPEDLIGHGFEVITHPDDILLSQESLGKLANQDTVRNVKVRWRDINGEHRWFEASGRQVDNDLIYVVCRDISERVELEADKKHLEKRLVATLSSMSDGFFMVDRNWRFTFVNPVAEQTLQVKSEQVLGKTLWECFPDALASVFERQYRKAMSSGESVHFETYFTPLSLWVEVHAYPSDDGLAVYFQDINERVFAQRHMQILERSVNASINGILIVDAQADDHPIIFANAGFERMSGYTPEEAIGRNCRFLQGERTSLEARLALREAIRDGKETHVVIENYRKDGTLFWNELYLSPVYDESETLTHFIGIQNDISSLEETRQLLAYKTHHDALTGLPNRQLILDRMAQALNQIRQPGHALGTLLIEIANYRELQEVLGPKVAQVAMMKIVNRLQSSLDTTSTLGMLDSVQLVVLIPEQTKSGIKSLLQSAIDCFSSAVDVEGESVHMIAKFGLAYARRTDTDPSELLRRAQVALSRQNARDSLGAKLPVPVYRAHMERSLQYQSRLRRRLRIAAEEENFSIAFQPLINAKTGRISGAEVLLRWHDSVLGSISPTEFIPVAEAEGLIDRLTDLLVDQLNDQIRKVLSPHIGSLQFNINISPLSLNSQFPDRLRDRLDYSVLPPGRMELELTESIALTMDDQLVATLNKLKCHGFSIAIDDFGTGFTGLSYLKDLPVDTLKIDRTFVQDVIRDGKRNSMVNSIVNLAQNLKLKLVAEGVEHANQVHHLTKAGIDVLQGYWFAKPLSAGEFSTFFNESGPRPGYVSLPTLDQAEQSRLLIVDPDQASGNALLRLFRKSPLSAVWAPNSQFAWELMQGSSVNVMICSLDVRDPESEAFLTEVNSRFPSLNIIVLSGSVSITDITRIINTGTVFRFLSRPCSDELLLSETLNATRADKSRT